MFRFVIITGLFPLAACSPRSAPGISIREITGNRTDRVGGVSAVITRHKAVPTAIVDAHFLQEQIGDGSLGPSDFRAFYSLELAPGDVAHWTQMLTPLGTAAEYATPAQPRDWWVSRATFDSLKFYKPDILTGRLHGWIGVSPQTGRIYIFTFTM